MVAGAKVGRDIATVKETALAMRISFLNVDHRHTAVAQQSVFLLPVDVASLEKRKLIKKCTTLDCAKGVGLEVGPAIEGQMGDV